MAIASRDIDEGLLKIRRFALIVGSVLLLYVLAGVQMKSPVTITAFGLVGFELVRPQLVGLGLLGVSAWSAFRFFYYGHLLSISPMRARRILRRGGVPDLDPSGTLDERILLSQGRQQVDRFFPVVRSGDPVQLDVVTGSGVVKIGRRPIRTKLVALWESVDYSAPLWLNALGITLFLACRLTFMDRVLPCVGD